MKRFTAYLAIVVMSIGVLMPTSNAKAQFVNSPGATAVSVPFALMNSKYFSAQPYKAVKQNIYYAVPDSLCIVNGYNYTNYFAPDTVRFATSPVRLMIQVSNSQPVGSFQMIVHKDSTGTINAATAILQGSDDGLNWVSLNDTMTCTNVTTNSHVWVLPNPYTSTTTVGYTATNNYNVAKYEFMPYLYYGILFTGVSTSKADIHAFYVPRHRSTAPN